MTLNTLLSLSARFTRTQRACALVLIAMLSLCLTQPSLADDDALANAVQFFLYEQTAHLGDEIQIDLILPSARFGDCDQPVPFLPRADSPLTGRVSVGVRCNGSSQSVRYLSAQVSVVGDYLQLAQAVERGTIIQRSMLSTARGDLSKLPPFSLTDETQIVGQQAARPLPAGTILRAQDIRAIPLVERGQEVVIESRGQGFLVTRRGEALDQGALGDTIRVRLSRQDLVTTTVSGQGRVALR